MKFERVCQSLNVYFAQHPVFKVLLPLSVPIMLVCAVLEVVGRFISLGGVVNILVFWGFLLGLLLVLSLCNFKMASIGLVIDGAGYVLSFLINLIRYHYVSYSSLLYVLLFGFFAFQAYRKSFSK